MYGHTHMKNTHGCIHMQGHTYTLILKTYMQAHMHMYAHTYIHLKHTCMHNMQTHIHMETYKNTHACTHASTHVHAHTCKNTYMQTQSCAHTLLSQLGSLASHRRCPGSMLEQAHAFWGLVSSSLAPSLEVRLVLASL